MAPQIDPASADPTQETPAATVAPSSDPANTGGDPASPAAAPGTVQPTPPAVEQAPADPGGLCRECFPRGFPEGATNVGCAHGQWSVPE